VVTGGAEWVTIYVCVLLCHMMWLQGLLLVAAEGVDSSSLTSGGNWSAVPATLPVVALAFVYHNIIPVICTALEGDVAKIRTAVLAGASVLSHQILSHH
jgi:tyrosine-specific transport protein